MTVALRATRVLTPAGVVDHAVVTVDDAAIADVGDGAADRELDGWLVPGLVDMHCHGGAGAGFLTTDPAEIDAAAAFHARAGTTSLIASLVSAPVDELCAALDTIAGVVEAGGTTLVGAHLEGPFLSPDFRGAHRVDHLAAPDADAFARMHEASRGTLRMLTIAPELPGADEVIEAAAERGVVVAVGHTACDYATAAAAFAGRATVTTHLFNAMPPIHHRAPGPAVAALESGAWCELICDGHHLDDAIIRLVAGRAPERMVLVTDAMAAAGMPDGPYRLGGHELQVEAGVARLTEGGALAGSTLTLDAAVRRVAAAGIPIVLALAAATAHPAAALGVTAGSITPGHPADLVWLTDDLQVRAVMHGGRWL